MFTGIIGSIGSIESAETQGDLRLVISCDFAPQLRLGESVACDGACLTVVEIQNNSFAVQLSAETLACTAPRWEKGRRVNLERALKLGDSLDGHLVTGHIDGIAIIEEITKAVPLLSYPPACGGTKGGKRLTFRPSPLASPPSGATRHLPPQAGEEKTGSHILCLEAPAPLSRFIAEKGSVTLDGVSLTVNKVENRRFWVNIIPHTWQNTTLGECKPGDGVNMEVDLMARYAARLLDKERCTS